VVAGGLGQLVEPDAVLSRASHGQMQACFPPKCDLSPGVTAVTEGWVIGP
jgi:hypothetical protein